MEFTGSLRDNRLGAMGLGSALRLDRVARWRECCCGRTAGGGQAWIWRAGFPVWGGRGRAASRAGWADHMMRKRLCVEL